MYLYIYVCIITTTKIEFPTRRPTDTTNNGIFPSDTGKD